ncbi:unnamed protein product [Rotaria socialis]|uniref:Uncharacterized protein n=1 Tax=Rotaria socialis TaxID=392032 RepID=A0A817S6Y6_9BILA|nr:unnamed protein product [Rotaria socialis]
MAVLRRVHTARRPRFRGNKMRLHYLASHFNTPHSKNLLQQKNKLNLITNLFDKWYSVHCVILSICIWNYFELFITSRRNTTVDLMYFKYNKSLIEYENSYSMQSEWCFSSATFLNHTKSYAMVDKSVDVLYATCFLLMIVGILLYVASFKQQCIRQITDCRVLFRLRLTTLFMIVGSSISNQLISAFTCRPIEMLYDKRYTLIIGTQMLVLIASLHFAYGFGKTFGSLVDPYKFPKKCTPRNINDRVPFLSQICDIP